MKKVSQGTDKEQLAKDLERYKKQALDLGAVRAAVVPVAEIPVEDRVVLKCQVPRCFGYGVCANCPPYTLKPAELREHLKSYSWAVFFTKDVPPEVIVRDKSTIKERVAAYKELSRSLPR